MHPLFALSAIADLRSILSAIARSAIFVRAPMPRAATVLQDTARRGRARKDLDWAAIRQSPEVDAYVLAWLAGEGREARARRRFDA